MDKDSLKADDNDVLLKDFSAPTLEDNFNKEALPQVLQVKNFGKRGRTKYTHISGARARTGCRCRCHMLCITIFSQYMYP
jgi:hypothetical protein